ncbi:MAG TPA: hypothetical protein VNX01_16145, partial [Bacteroidia bacterium]|nr:hypothetical protein [Bacteroidia bacterium]
AKIGFTKIDHFLPENECAKLYSEIISLSETYKESTKLDNGTFISYRSDNLKDGPDKGMIDIYDIDKTVKINVDYKKIEEIIRGTYSCDVYFTSMHAYVNRGVEGTRVFHVDNCQPVVYKAFIYLTDVTDIEYGPYSFVKGTQRLSLQVYYNLVRNLFFKKYRSSDMPKYRKSKEIIGLGKKGSLIISNQNGIHRGYPQKKGKERVALILNYMVISKLNYMHDTAKQTINNSFKKI